MKYFIANWKANKTYVEAADWTGQFLNQLNLNPQAINKLNNDQVKIIICPPLPFIIPLKEKFKNQKNVSFGSQDVSEFEKGTFTGEITAYTLSGLIEYSLIGHSERRKNFMETDIVLFNKNRLAKKYGYKTMYCFSNQNQILPKDADFLCFEPIEAISTGDGKGKNEKVENILKLKINMNLPTDTKFIYGGSVNEENINQYLNHQEIDGFLVGGASLDPLRFFKMIFF